MSNGFVVSLLFAFKTAKHRVHRPFRGLLPSELRPWSQTEPSGEGAESIADKSASIMELFFTVSWSGYTAVQNKVQINWKNVSLIQCLTSRKKISLWLFSVIYCIYLRFQSALPIEMFPVLTILHFLFIFDFFRFSSIIVLLLFIISKHSEWSLRKRPCSRHP